MLVETAPKVVLDTNVYVSGTILSRGSPFEILESWRRGQFTLVVSEAILREIERVLRYPHIQERYHLAEETIQRLLISLRTDAHVVSGLYEVSAVLADITDNPFLACALEGHAQYVVTGDAHLLNLKQYHGVRILTPREFLELYCDRGLRPR